MIRFGFGFVFVLHRRCRWLALWLFLLPLVREYVKGGATETKKNMGDKHKALTEVDVRS